MSYPQNLRKPPVGLILTLVAFTIITALACWRALKISPKSAASTEGVAPIEVFVIGDRGYGLDTIWRNNTNANRGITKIGQRQLVADRVNGLPVNPREEVVAVWEYIGGGPNDIGYMPLPPLSTRYMFLSRCKLFNLTDSYVMSSMGDTPLKVSLLPNGNLQNLPPPSK